ncbi:MAG: hypothetical protein DWQ44_10160 [Bacteroidetes bacterium]|nr:MAG: hypothetical protein DWQ33_10435 [Bacteroidota bacterium]REK06640.1 MAG: hypothetical protein DWQ39_03950 [Bacteroidota bacterium]REK33406.1 MAG: hypothetical protein DWQ44_10160 [Bacteroidota bacterium]REK49804.1 MAG: hypothetical protein DWQ48_06715 [Bacteroidota bacterium]
MNRNLGVLSIIGASIFFLSLSSCKKENKCEAGSGGGVNVTARLLHHDVLIPNDSLRPDTVWIKYNAIDWASAPSGYDARFIGEFGEDHVHINGLKCGDYYFYASGWDSNISEVVRGGRSLSFNQGTGEIPLEIFVTE